MVDDLYGYQDPYGGQDLSLEQFFGYEAAPPPRSRVADALDILFRREQDSRQREVGQMLEYQRLGRRAQEADLADQGDEGDMLPFNVFQQNVGWEQLSPEQQQAEYDYYVDKIAGGRLASTSDREAFRREFSKAAPRPSRSRTASDYVVDPLLDLGRGVVGLGEAVTGVADLATYGLAGDAMGFADQQLRELLGLGGSYKDAGGARGAIGRMQSAPRQQARQNVEQAEGFGGTLRALAENPSELAGIGIESVPLMLGSSAVAAGRAAQVGQALTPAQAKLWAAIGEGTLTAGSVASEIRDKNPDNRLAMYLGIPAGAVTAGFSRFGGDIEARIGSAAARTGTANRALSAGKQAFMEVFEEMPQSVSEQIFTNLGTGRPWDEGLAKVAAIGLAAGASTGAAFGAAFPGAETASQVGTQPAAAPADNPLFQGGRQATPAEIAQMQEADVVSGIVDQNLSPLTVEEGPMGPPTPYLTDQIEAALGSRRLPQKSREWLELALLEVDTLPEGAEREQALKDLAAQLETRLENYRGNLTPNHWLMVTKDLVDAAVAREEGVRPQSAPVAAREVSTLNEAFEMAMQRDPTATERVVADQTLDEDGMLDALLEVATAPTAAAPAAVPAQQASNPLVENPRIQVERPDEAVAFGRQQQTANARRAVLERLMQQDVDEDTLAIAFTQALNEEGFSNPAPTPEEINTMRRYGAVRTALDQAMVEERSPEVDNSSMEALIPERFDPLQAAPAVPLDKEAYTANLTPLQIGFIKNVLLEAARRGVPVSQARAEMVTMLSRVNDPRAQEAASVDFSRVARLGKMAREVSKALPRKRTPPQGPAFELTAPAPAEGPKRRSAKPSTRAEEVQTAEQGELFAEEAEEGEKVLTKGQAKAFVVAALRNTGLYEGELGMRSMRADVEALMGLLEENAIDGVYTEQDVRDAVSNMAEYFGGASLEMAGAPPSILMAAHVHHDIPLIPGARVPLNFLPAIQPEHRRLMQMLFDLAAGMMPADTSSLIQSVGYTFDNTKTASYSLGTRRMTVNPDWLDSILRHGGADNLRSATATMLHEIQHAVDRSSATSLVSPLLPEFDFEYITMPDGRVVVNGTGAIMREAVDAYNMSQDEGSLDYPLTYTTVRGPDGRPTTVQPSRMKGEVFAQLGRLYFSNRALLGQISPAALNFFGDIYGNAPSITESIARLRGKVPAERAGNLADGQVGSVPSSALGDVDGSLADRGAGERVAQRGGMGLGGVTDNVPAYGTPRPGAMPPVQAIHYSRELRKTLVSSYFGTGLKGAERSRIDTADPVLNNRINFYVNAGRGIIPEAGVGGVAHQVILNNVYDTMADPLDIARNNAGDANQLERAVAAAGFDGYMAPAGNQNAVVLVGRHTVPVAPFTGDRNQTQVVQLKEKERVGVDAFSRDGRLPAGQLTGPMWRNIIERMYPEVYAQYAGAEVWASEERMYRDELARALRSSETELAEQYIAVQPLRQDVDGKFKGAPNDGSVKAYRKLKAEMMKLVSDPLAQWGVSKDWYYKSHDAVLEMFPNDPERQEKAFRMLAIYSQANSLGANVTAVLKSFGDIMEGRPVARGRFPAKVMQILPQMLAAPTLDRSVPGVDNKIMSFYRNLRYARDPEFLQESTIDRWMLRLFGYSGMDEARAATPDEYAYSRHLLSDMANDLSAPGQPIAAHQVQAALWTFAKNRNELAKWEMKKQEKKAELREMKARFASLSKVMGKELKLAALERDRVTLGSPNEDQQRLRFYDRRIKMLEGALRGKYAKFEPQYADYADYFVRNVATSTMEMVPHPDTGVLVNLSSMPAEVVHAYTVGMQSVLLDDKGNDLVLAAIFDNAGVGSDKNRLVNILKEEGFGSFEGVISPNDTTTMLVAKADDAKLAKLTPKLMNAYVSMVGYIYNQKAAMWHKLNPKGKVEGAVLRFPATPSFDQLTSLYDLLRAKMPGVEFSKVGPEIRLLNFTGSSMQEFMDQIGSVVENYTGTDFLDAREARFDTGYIENDWRKYKNGEVYLEQIQLLGQPDLIGLARDLRSQANDLNRDFARNFPDAGSAEFSPTRQPSGPEREAVLFAQGSTGTITGFDGPDMRFYAKLNNPATGDYTVYVASSGSVSDPANASNVVVYTGRNQTQVFAMLKSLGLSRTVRTKLPKPTPGNPLVASQMVDLTTITDKKAAESGNKLALIGRELKRKIVDSKEVIERLQGRLKELDPNLPDSLQLWTQDETLASAIAERVYQENQKYGVPLVNKLQELQKKGITIEDFDNYVWSLVTPYRNAIIYKRTDGDVSDGAGQTNAQAMQTVRDFEMKGQATELQQAADMLFRMMNRQLQINEEFGVDSKDDVKWQSDAYSKRDLNAEVAAGLLTPSDYQEAMQRGWNQPRAVPWYAPMKTFVDSEFEIPRSTTSGGSKKYALGRRTKPDSIAVFGFQQFNASIPRGLDNRFKQNVYATAVAYQDVNFWIVDEVPVVEYLDQTTGLVKRTVDKNYKRDDGVLVLRIEGRDHTVRFTAPEVAEALIRQPAKARTVVGGAIVNTVGTAMRLLSGTHTAFNPNFWLVNLTRDAASVLLNAPPEVQKVFKAEYLKQLANPKTWDDSARYAWHDTSWGAGRYPNASAEWKEFAENGGPVRFDAYLGGFDQTQEDLNTLVRPTKMQQASNFGAQAMNTVTGLSETMDNGVRFAAYKAARAAGVSPQAAAAMAKNATANFERRGSLEYLNMMYMFFNAAVQGTRNTARAISRSRVTQGAVMGLVIAGFVAGALGYASGGEDEDDYHYAKVPNFTRDKKLVIDPNGFAIPLPQGFNWFYALGNSIADMVYSKRSDKIQRGLLRITNAFTDTFIPNDPPNADSMPQYVMDLVTPELLKPVVQTATNKNSFGRSIIPDAQFRNEAMPDVKKGTENASEWSKKVAGALYTWNMDVSPATLDYLAKYYTGGVGKLWQDVQAPQEGFTPKTPIAGKFVSPGPVDYDLRSNLEAAQRDLLASDNFTAKLLAEDIKREMAMTAQFRGIVKGTPEYSRLLTERDQRRRVLLRRYDDLKKGE